MSQQDKHAWDIVIENKSSPRKMKLHANVVVCNMSQLVKLGIKSKAKKFPTLLFDR